DVEIVSGIAEKHCAVAEVGQNDGVRAIETVGKRLVHMNPCSGKSGQIGAPEDRGLPGRVYVNELKNAWIPEPRGQSQDRRRRISISRFDLVNVGEVRRRLECGIEFEIPGKRYTVPVEPLNVIR